MPIYRRRRGSDTWHWCTNCSNWPTEDFEKRNTKPISGELCIQCRAKKKEGICRKL